MADLTAKQEAFCLAYLETGNASEAYRRVYNASAMKTTTINRNAKVLLGGNKIATRIATLRAPAIQAAQMTVEGHLKRLLELSKAAEDEGKYAAAVTAEMARGKVSGFYIDKIQAEVTVNGMAERMRQRKGN